MSELYKDLLYCYIRPCNNPSNNAFFLPIKDVYLGVEVANLLNKPEILQNEVMVEDIKKRCRDFFIVSCCQIKMRFDFDNPVLKSLDDLNPKKVFSNNRPNSFISFIQLFPRINNKYNIQEIDDGWRKFNTVKLEPEYIIKLKALNVEKCWVNLKNKEVDNEYQFRVLSNFVLTVLSLPQSYVSCERMFSKINLIKTKQRNRLQTPTLNGLLNASQCMQETTCCKFEPSQDIFDLMTSSNLYSNLNSNDNDNDDEIIFIDL